MPTIEAEPPSNSPPIDHKPRSMKKKLSTRPRRCGGVNVCNDVLTDARNAMKQKPTEVRRINDRRKNPDAANNPRKIPYPKTNAQTQKGFGMTLPKEASHKAAAMAPMPGADMRRPKPVGPTCRIFVANTGTKVEYGAPTVATT